MRAGAVGRHLRHARLSPRAAVALHCLIDHSRVAVHSDVPGRQLAGEPDTYEFVLVINCVLLVR